MVLTYASKLHWRQLSPGSVTSKCLSLETMMANGLIASAGKGLFTMLPLGQRIVDKFVKIIDDEMRSIGAQKMQVPALGAKKLWVQSGRWDAMGDEMYRLKDRLNSEYCLQPTAEEMFTCSVAANVLRRNQSLPLMLYQTSNKYRDEMNPRFGLIRSKQFLMNDLYTFDLDQSTAQHTYRVIKDMYRRIFGQILGLDQHVIRVQASPGAMGGDVSHEFHLPNPSAEDALIICRKCKSTVKRDEMADPDAVNCAKCGERTERLDTVEVGHTFQLGDRYSRTFRAMTAQDVPYFMCCFGLGVTRIIAASIDVLTASNKAMRLPEVLAPFKLAVVLPKEETANAQFVKSFLDDLDAIPRLKHDILVDDRGDKSVGRRINELNQLGVPHILVASGHKHTDPCAVQKVEYFRTAAGSEDIIKVGILTHADIFKTFQRY